MSVRGHIYAEKVGCTSGFQPYLFDAEIPDGVTREFPPKMRGHIVIATYSPKEKETEIVEGLLPLIAEFLLYCRIDIAEIKSGNFRGLTVGDAVEISLSFAKFSKNYVRAAIPDVFDEGQVSLLTDVLNGKPVETSVSDLLIRYYRKPDAIPINPHTLAASSTPHGKGRKIELHQGTVRERKRRPNDFIKEWAEKTFG